jgi:hypothetical protein
VETEARTDSPFPSPKSNSGRLNAGVRAEPCLVAASRGRNRFPRQPPYTRCRSQRRNADRGANPPLGRESCVCARTDPFCDGPHRGCIPFTDRP